MKHTNKICSLQATLGTQNTAPVKSLLRETGAVSAVRFCATESKELFFYIKQCY